MKIPTKKATTVSQKSTSKGRVHFTARVEAETKEWFNTFWKTEKLEGITNTGRFMDYIAKRLKYDET